MLLALDVGNTNVTIGLFDGESAVHHWRLSTVHEQTADEWGILLRTLFSLEGRNITEVDGVIIASVVPPLDSALAQMCGRYFHVQPLFVTHSTDIGIRNLYDNPAEVGADRLVNAVAAFHKYGGPCIVVDLGTAITFDVISEGGDYLGGIIAAGVGISTEALFSRTARLPRVDFREPEKLIGSNTVSSIQSGLYYGALGAIDGIVERLAAQLGPGAKVIGTGGQAALIARGSRYLTRVDEHLTLDGLRLIWNRNRAS